MKFWILYAILFVLPLFLGPVGILSGRWDFFLKLHLPRFLLGAEVGALLALSGLLLQSLFRNRLADPFTLGVSGGAALGVGIGIFLGAAFLAPFALAGGIIPIALLFFLTRRMLARESDGLLVAGIGLTATTAAFLLLMQYILPGGDALRLMYWLMGDLSIVGFSSPLWLFPSLVGVAALLWWRRNELDLILEGEEIAVARGVEIGWLRKEWIVLASWATAATVAEAGPIFFVGLIIPNLCRSRYGASHLQLIPATLLWGMVALPWCDLAARTLSDTPVPIGVTTALIGGPFLLWAVLGTKRRP